MSATTTTETGWFLDVEVRLDASHDAGADGLSAIVCESATHAPPLHVHHTEDELFHVVAGSLRLVVAGDERVVAAGETALAPKGVPHALKVEAAPARWLVVTAHGDFEAFVRSQLTDAPAEPARAALAAAAAEYGIEIVGPPLA